MRFRNYGKFSCTSGSVYPRAYKGRAWPWSHGNEDGSASVRRSGTFIQVFWEAQVPLALTIVLPWGDGFLILQKQKQKRTLTSNVAWTSVFVIKVSNYNLQLYKLQSFKFTCHKYNNTCY
jgi:hypothetical protein